MRLKPNTQVHVRGVVRRDILPALGKVRVAAVKRRHVIELQQSPSGRPVAANTAAKVLSHMYRLGEGWGLVPEGCNSCREVKKHPERRRERFLTDVEFSRLGRVMEDSLDGGRGSPTAVAVIRLLMLTGCRKREILILRHTYASRALALGEDLPIIGRLLGHSDIETASRFAHLPDDLLHEAAGRIADSIADDISC